MQLLAQLNSISSHESLWENEVSEWLAEKEHEERFAGVLCLTCGRVL